MIDHQLKQSGEYIGKTGVGQRLHRSTRTIEKWMKCGYLPYLRVGRSVLFHWPSVERHLNENYQQSQRPKHGLPRWKQNLLRRAVSASAKPSDQNHQGQEKQAEN